MTTMNTTDQPRAVACIRFVRRWRTAVDGVWHDELPFARVIDAVEMNGQQIFRNEGEHSLSFIHRVADWAQDIFDSANAGAQPRGN